MKVPSYELVPSWDKDGDGGSEQHWTTIKQDDVSVEKIGPFDDAEEAKLKGYDRVQILAETFVKAKLGLEE